MLLEIRKLNKSFERGGRPLPAVNGVDFDLEEGEFAHIVGRSGSGKTTLLNLIAGIVQADSGQVCLSGQSMQELTKEELASFRNCHIGYIPQRAVLLESLTAFENVLLPWYLNKRDGDAVGRCNYLFDKLGISELRDSYANQLSGGELRRIQIARALINDPQILLADEPTSDLDQATTQEVMDLLKRLNQDGLSLLVVTHELETLAYGTKVYTMTEGKLESGLNLQIPGMREA